MKSRLDRVRGAMEERSLTAMLVTTPAGVRWLSGFTSPEDGRVLVTRHDAWLITDGRYTAQADQESSLPVVIERDWYASVAERVRSGPLGVEAEHLTLATAASLASRTGQEPVRTEGLISRLRWTKDADEIATIRRAAELTDRAYAHALKGLHRGVREVDVALAIEHFVRTHGGERMAFDVIVASGERSAMPHGVASERELRDGDLVTIDLGATVNGYCSDMTRTFGVGNVSEAHQRMYRAVLEAQQAAVAAVRPGISGKALDTVARDILADRGYGEAFSHSLGHGVGLEVHEDPRLSAKSDHVLAAGMVVTVEPGAYLPGDAGCRIEDLVLVTDEGHEILSTTAKVWLSVDLSGEVDADDA